MNEMVERLARALCVAVGDDPDVMVWPHRAEQRTALGYRVATTQVSVPLWQTRAAEASAALADMREPTEAMLNLASADLDNQLPFPNEVKGAVGSKHISMVRLWQAYLAGTQD